MFAKVRKFDIYHLEKVHTAENSKRARRRRNTSSSITQNTWQMSVKIVSGDLKLLQILKCTKVRYTVRAKDRVYHRKILFSIVAFK